MALLAGPLMHAGADAIVRERRERGVVIIGSRKSDLAMWQARHVAGRLGAAFPHLTFEIATEVTTGDHILHTHLAALAAVNPGIFTKELEVGLVSGAYDLAVHSLKDMPTTLPDGLGLAAITEREDPRDVLIVSARHGTTSAGLTHVSELPAGWVIGTSSLRREALLRRLAPHVQVRTIRGNLNTRLRKLDTPPTNGSSGGGEEEAFDAILLAAAGVKRMGWWDRVTFACEPNEWPYGVGQGALGVETRQNDEFIVGLCATLVHGETAAMCLTERTFLNRLQGGCQVPIGVHSTLARGSMNTTRAATTESPASSTAATADTATGVGSSSSSCGILTVAGTVVSLDGSHSVAGTVSGAFDFSGEVGGAARTAPQLWTYLVDAAAVLGRQLADKVIAAGATEILGPLVAARPITYGAAEASLE